MTAPRCVLFDLDGTLVDSAPDIAAALNIALETMGRPPLDLGTVKGMVGGGARLLVERALLAAGAGAHEVEPALECFLDAYRARPAALSRPYEGVLDALSGFAAGGVRLGVCTNKPENLARSILDRLGLLPFFGAVCGSMPGLALKPAPDLLRMAMRTLGTAPGETAMVGDSRRDVEAAKAAGCRVLVFAGGYGGEPAHTLGADAVFRDFHQLHAALAAMVLAQGGG